MSSGSSVGEFGWILAPRWSRAPRFEPGSGLKIFAETATSSSFDISFTTQAMTSLDRPGMTAWIAASSRCSRKRFSSPNVQSAHCACACMSRPDWIARSNPSSSGGCASTSASLVAASSFLAFERPRSDLAATPTVASPSLNALAAPSSWE